jgi:hypothetical protein
MHERLREKRCVKSVKQLGKQESEKETWDTP